MFTLAGNTATSVAISHHAPQREERSDSMASPPAISATPLAVDELTVGGERLGHDRLVRARLDEVHRPRAEEEQRDGEATAHQGADPSGSSSRALRSLRRSPSPSGRPPWASR